jgi:hypothetical protein
VNCPAFVRFRGVKAVDDSSIAVVITSQFKHFSSNPLKALRSKFEDDYCQRSQVSVTMCHVVHICGAVSVREISRGSRP